MILSAILGKFCVISSGTVAIENDNKHNTQDINTIGTHAGGEKEEKKIS